MKFFILVGKDISSDTGCFEIIMTAVNLEQASHLIAQHLVKRGRMDLVKLIPYMTEIKPDGHSIIYSNVQEL